MPKHWELGFGHHVFGGLEEFSSTSEVSGGNYFPISMTVCAGLDVLFEPGTKRMAQMVTKWYRYSRVKSKNLVCQKFVSAKLCVHNLPARFKQFPWPEVSDSAGCSECLSKGMFKFRSVSRQQEGPGVGHKADGPLPSRDGACRQWRYHVLHMQGGTLST